MRIYIHQALEELGVYLGTGIVVGINNRLNSPELDKLMEATVGSVKSSLTVEGLKDDEIIRLYRDFYWRLGIDPTKQRPAQEALIRRILRGGGLPKINPAVDIGNIVSVKYKVPVGLYDIKKIGGVSYIVLRRAAEGELFTPLGSPKMTLSSNQIVLATDDGRIIHVFPYRDSELTKVDEFTSDVLIVVAGIGGIPEDIVMGALTEIEALFENILGGKVLMHGLVKPGKPLEVRV